MDAKTPTPTPAEMVEEYITLRDAKRRADDQYAVWLKANYSDRMNELESMLLEKLQELGVDSFASKKGTAYRKTAASVTTADAAEFRRHVIGLEAWDLADWKPNKTMINEMVERGEDLPPGVNYTAIATVGIRRK
jgi:hypothetical protein